MKQVKLPAFWSLLKSSWQSYRQNWWPAFANLLAVGVVLGLLVIVPVQIAEFKVSSLLLTHQAGPLPMSTLQWLYIAFLWNGFWQMAAMLFVLRLFILHERTGVWPELSQLFHNFGQKLVTLFNAAGWLVLLCVPPMIVMSIFFGSLFIGVATGSIDPSNPLWPILSITALVIGVGGMIVWGLYLSLTYGFYNFVAADDLSMSGLECIKRTKFLMTGHRVYLLCMSLLTTLTVTALMLINLALFKWLGMNGLWWVMPLNILAMIVLLPFLPIWYSKFYLALYPAEDAAPEAALPPVFKKASWVFAVIILLLLGLFYTYSTVARINAKLEKSAKNISEAANAIPDRSVQEVAPASSGAADEITDDTTDKPVQEVAPAALSAANEITESDYFLSEVPDESAPAVADKPADKPAAAEPVAKPAAEAAPETAPEAARPGSSLENRMQKDREAKQIINLPAADETK